MQKTDHSQFTTFILSEFDQIHTGKKNIHRSYFVWIASLLITVGLLVLGAFNGGEIDRRITGSLYNTFFSTQFFSNLGNILQYAYILFLAGALVCCVIAILYFNPKTREKLKYVSIYAILYLLVLSFSVADHLILQIIVNRFAYDPMISSLHPFYRINPDISGIWQSSFPNNNLILSGVVILVPVLFGRRGVIFKWFFGIMSGIVVLFIAFTEIGLSGAWFTDTIASIGIVLFWSWMFYWHILFVKPTEDTILDQKLTSLYNQAYNNLLNSQSFLKDGNIEECKKYLSQAKELFNQSISLLQNMPGDISSYISRNEFWKYNVNLLIKDLEEEKYNIRKWQYVF